MNRPSDKAISQSRRLHAEAVDLLNQGEVDAAIKLFAEASALDPRDAALVANHGYGLLQAEQYEEALDRFDRAIELRPNWPLAHFNRGMVLYKTGRFGEARDAYEMALRYQPDYLEAKLNFGYLSALCGDLDGGAALIQTVLDERPEFIEAHVCRAKTYLMMELPGRAIAQLETALEIAPSDPDILLELAQCSHDVGDHTKMLWYALSATQKNPDNAKAAISYAGFLMKTRYYTTARDFLLSIEDKFPDEPEIPSILCQCYSQLSDAEAGYRYGLRAIEMVPDNPSVYMMILFAMNYLQRIDAEETFSLAKKFGEAASSQMQYLKPFMPTGSRDPERKLRVGFFSADLREHSCSYYIEAVFRHLDRERFTVVAIPTVNRSDSRTTILRQMADEWVNAGSFNDKLINMTERMRLLSLDVAFDLGGHTSNNALMQFAGRMAPIQVNWMGYPNTTGLRAMDYRLIDEVTDPPGLTDPYYTETLVRMPAPFLCYAPPRSTPPVEDKSARSDIVFGSFNATAKFNPPVIEAWTRILERVPNSRLVIKSHQLADDELRKGFMDYMCQFGADPARIEIFRPMPGTFDHLNLYNEVDIGLDTFPYNGTTTTCEAMWMGVPVVTFAGDVHSARVGATLCQAVGLEEMVAGDIDGYVDHAVALAENVARLRTLQQGLRERLRQSVLCDQVGYVRRFEQILRKLWQDYCADGLYEEQRRARDAVLVAS